MSCLPPKEGDALNLKAMSFIKNISYTITSNLITLIVSILITLIIPKLIGIQEYGYWQLYLFYVSYVGFLHFGWNDGVYLRYGGKNYNDIDKKLLNSQFVMLSLSQIIIGLIILTINERIGTGYDKNYVVKMVSIALVLTNLRYLFLYILQATNRIKDYANITIIDRAIYIILIIILIGLGVRDYKVLIIADIIGRMVSLVLALYLCRDITFLKINDIKFNFNEAYENITAGSKLMIANIASMLIVGTIRFGIEKVWDVETFGKVSLTLSISNMMMIFINAIGIIMFPLLRQTEKRNLSNIYFILRDFLMLLLLGLLIFYYPLKTAMTIWLPQYEESLLFMALIFPIFIYEGKVALLINTYFKTLRKEKLMLKINLITMSISVILTYLSTFIFRSLTVTIANIVILLAFRSIFAEYHLAKILKIEISKDVLLELLLTLIFILSGWFVNSWMTMLIYGVSYMIYLLIKRNDINRTIRNIKLLMKA